MLKNKRNLLKTILAILIIVSSVLALSACGKKEEQNNEQVAADEYLQPLKNYFDGIKNKDVDQILKAFPEFMDMKSKITSEEVDALYEQYETIYGSNVKIDYSFGEVTELSEEDLSELENELNTMYENEENIDITAGYLVPVTVTLTGDGVAQNNNEVQENDDQENQDQETSENEEETNQNASDNNTEQDNMYVLKYNDNWYMM